MRSLANPLQSAKVGARMLDVITTVVVVEGLGDLKVEKGVYWRCGFEGRYSVVRRHLFDRGVCDNNLWLFKEIKMGSLNLEASEIFVVTIESKQIAKDYSMFSNQLRLPWNHKQAR